LRSIVDLLPIEISELLHVSDSNGDDECDDGCGDEGDDEGDDGGNDGGDDDGGDGFLEDIIDSIDSLHDLTPYVEDLHSASENSNTSTSSSATELTLTAQHYRSYIMDMYKGIDHQLANTLGNLNVQRHQRIQEWARTNTSRIDKDDKIENTIKTGWRPSIIPDPVSYPPPPVKLVAGEPFTCNICFKQTILPSNTVDCATQWKLVHEPCLNYWCC
jgi:hypothetical protein